jgi:spermidine synthase
MSSDRTSSATLPARAPLALLVALQGVVSAASLIVEIVAGRMIAPYVGMSLYTWTAIIAVVLAGFSAGHWWGGRIAERDTPAALRLTAWTMIGAAVTTGGATFLLRQVAGPLLSMTADPLAAITLLTAAVFFLPSLFAGVPAPVLAVVAIRGTGRSGHALGAMFAAGAIGAIAGTLLAGFLFIAWLGSILTLTIVTVVYVVSAVALFMLSRRGAGIGGVLAMAGALGLGLASLALPSVCDTESRYFCLRTVELAPEGTPPVRLMVIDHLAHGISARDAPLTMHSEYSAMLDELGRLRMGDREFSSFFIGGGSYTVPRAWAARGTGPITVAEIDPAVTETAARDFWFDPASAEILHGDARRVLAENPRIFDIIVGDAFTDIAVPAHLVTREFFLLVEDRLADGGIYLMNVVDHSDRLEALGALVRTLRTVFPSVEVWTEERPPVENERRVFVLVAGDAPTPVDRIVAPVPEPKAFAALGEGFVDALVARRGAVLLTDDYAPIDRLVGLGVLID